MLAGLPKARMRPHPHAVGLCPAQGLYPGAEPGGHVCGLFPKQSALESMTAPRGWPLPFCGDFAAVLQTQRRSRPQQGLPCAPHCGGPHHPPRDQRSEWPPPAPGHLRQQLTLSLLPTGTPALSPPGRKRLAHSGFTATLSKLLHLRISRSSWLVARLQGTAPSSPVAPGPAPVHSSATGGGRREPTEHQGSRLDFFPRRTIRFSICAPSHECPTLNV